jgi:hypothetical protein
VAASKKYNLQSNFSTLSIQKLDNDVLPTDTKKDPMTRSLKLDIKKLKSERTGGAKSSLKVMNVTKPQKIAKLR